MNEAISKREIEAYAKRQLPPGWRLVDGCNMEQCPETGRYHYQYMLKTPQVRKSAVIAQMDKAHIELAKHRAKVQNYCQKDDTRVATIEAGSSIPTIFEYQGIIAKQWKDEEYEKWRKVFPRKDMDEVAMFYLDSLVSADIAKGRRGPEWIATNPMWRNAWKKFWRVIIERENAAAPQSEPTGEADEAADEAAPPSDGSGGCEDFYGDRGD